MTNPFITLASTAAVPIKSLVVVGQNLQDFPTIDSFEYATGLAISIFKFGQFVGFCNNLIDPMLDAESDCFNFVGNEITVTRTCPTGSCKLGICSQGIMTDCDCSNT